jgi:hypothetical protein
MQEELEDIEEVEGVEGEEDSGVPSYEELMESRKITAEDIKEHMTGPVISTVVHIIFLAFLGTIVVFEAQKEAKEIAVEMKVLEIQEIEPPPPPPEEPEPVELEDPTETPVERPNLEVDVNVKVENISVDNPNEIEMPSMLNVKMSNSALRLAIPAGGGSGGISGKFFGTGGSGNKFCFIIDFSASMSFDQLLVVKSHLMKALKGFGGRGSIVVLFFAGPVWLPEQVGSEVEAAWGGRSHHLGEDKTAVYPTPKWMNPTGRNLALLNKYICETPKVWGTNWAHPFRVALTMKQKPDVIFFMTDGSVASSVVAECMELVKEHGKTVTINTIDFGMKGEVKLKALSAASKGGVYKGFTNEELKVMAQGINLPTKFPEGSDFSYSPPRAGGGGGGKGIKKEKEVQGLEIK